MKWWNKVKGIKYVQKKGGNKKKGGKIEYFCLIT